MDSELSNKISNSFYDDKFDEVISLFENTLDFEDFDMNLFYYTESLLKKDNPQALFFYLLSFFTHPFPENEIKNFTLRVIQFYSNKTFIKPLISHFYWQLNLNYSFKFRYFEKQLENGKEEQKSKVEITRYKNLMEFTSNVAQKIKNEDPSIDELKSIIESEDPIGVDLSKTDGLLLDAVKLILDNNQASTTFIQRELAIGYNRAGRIFDQLEMFGIIGPFEGKSSREILIYDKEEAIEKIHEHKEGGNYQQNNNETNIEDNEEDTLEPKEQLLLLLDNENYDDFKLKFKKYYTELEYENILKLFKKMEYDNYDIIIEIFEDYFKKHIINNGSPDDYYVKEIIELYIADILIQRKNIYQKANKEYNFFKAEMGIISSEIDSKLDLYYSKSVTVEYSIKFKKEKKDSVLLGLMSYTANEKGETVERRTYFNVRRDVKVTKKMAEDKVREDDYDLQKYAGVLRIISIKED